MPKLEDAVIVVIPMHGIPRDFVLFMGRM